MKKVNEIESKQKYMWLLHDTNEMVSSELISKSKTYCDLFQERLSHMFLHVLNKYLSSLYNVLA